jgi:hypothetical protein
MMEPKGMDAVEIDSFVRRMVLSNSDWVVPAAFDERRFLVCDVGTERQQDTAYFAAIDAQMETGGAAAMLHDLLRYAWFVDLRNPPKTEELVEQAMHGMSVEMGSIKIRGRLPPSLPPTSAIPASPVTLISHGS